MHVLSSSVATYGYFIQSTQPWSDKLYSAPVYHFIKLPNHTILCIPNACAFFYYALYAQFMRFLVSTLFFYMPDAFLPSVILDLL